jgi:hypothetical protein
MPGLPPWESEEQGVRSSDDVLIYRGSTKLDGTVTDFTWEIGCLRENRRAVTKEGMLTWEIGSDSYYGNYTYLWEVSHWMPLPPIPKADGYEVPDFLRPLLNDYLKRHEA